MNAMGLDIDGTILGQSRLSEVDGPTGRLGYCGYDFHELATHATWEEVAYLLWYGDLPTSAELADLRERLATARALDAEELALLRTLPRYGHGMYGLHTAVSALAQLRPPAQMNQETVLAEGLQFTARLPVLLAGWLRLRAGQEPVLPNPALDQAANFLWMLHGVSPDPVAIRALNTYMVVLAENGLNISTFVACVVASTQNDMPAAITAAIATLKGLAHGGANEYAMRTFQAMGTPEATAAYLDGMLQRKERLMGVGHRVFEVEDPRVRHMRQQSAALAARPDTDGTSHAVAERVAELLRTVPYFRDRQLYPNVEFYSAPLLYQLGFPLDAFTAAFACARMPGWTAHIAEQMTNRRVVRPEAAYVGPAPRPFVPLAARG